MFSRRFSTYFVSLNNVMRSSLHIHIFCLWNMFNTGKIENALSIWSMLYALCARRRPKWQKWSEKTNYHQIKHGAAYDRTNIIIILWMRGMLFQWKSYERFVFLHPFVYFQCLSVAWFFLLSVRLPVNFQLYFFTHAPKRTHNYHKFLIRECEFGLRM